MNQEKLLYSLIGLLVLILTFMGGYLFNQEPEPANISESLERFSENTPLSTNKLPPKLAQITSSKVITAINGDPEDILYIEKESGKVIKTDKDGTEHQTVSGVVLKNITRAVWPSSGSGFIYYAKNVLKESAYHFNLKDKKISAFSESASSLVFSPDSKNVSYHFWDQNAQEGSISISQTDGSSFKEIIKTRVRSLKIDWPKEFLLSFYEKTPASEASNLFLLEIGSGRKLTKILENKIGLDVKWSTDGNNLIYSFFEPNGLLKLVLRELASNQETVLPFVTFASKCTFALNNNLLYCGVPFESPIKPIKPEYLSSKDKIISWDRINKKEKIILELASFEDVQIIAPFLDSLGNYLFFINSFDEKLYRLAL